MTAHGGSPYIQYDFLTVMEKRGVNRVRPMSLVGGIIGSLYITLATSFKIRGAALGFNSACASSAHAIGYACDQIRLGRLDRVFVVGGEDPMKFTALPFAAARALSTADDPSRYPCAFDKNRDGFVPTGGAVAMVVESLESAQARGAPIQAEILGWADSADGYNVMAPEPNGEGLARAMRSALRETGVQLGEVDYINAHATGTPSGDTAELRAVKAVFDRGYVPMISSTKSLTGHGLSMAGVLEGAIATMALRDGFIPVSANIRELDPEAEGVPVVTERVDKSARIALSNSSGFGGSNVVLVFKKWEE
jgi:3-oxoacyl-(acyl-carrier-protein) synthase